MSSLLTKLRAKKVPSASLTLNYQILPELGAKLEDVVTRSKITRYDICRAALEAGLDLLIAELDAEPESEDLPDLTPTPEYSDTIADDLD
jgi:hypothetical protein